MKLQIIFATGNENKVREIREIIQDPEIKVVSMKQLGIKSDPEETGTTFQENALIKARACAQEIRKHPEIFSEAIEGAGPAESHSVSSSSQDLPSAGSSGKTAARLDSFVPAAVLSDDSGLVIDALDGAPGIYSARYMGRDTSYTLKMNHIMKELDENGAGGTGRSARFVCACAAVLPKGMDPHSSETEEIVVTGTMEGEIAHEIRGANGFGYDPFFWLPEYGRTSAELTDDEKNAISHRGRAFRAMIGQLKDRLAQ